MGNTGSRDMETIKISTPKFKDFKTTKNFMISKFPVVKTKKLKQYSPKTVIISAQDYFGLWDNSKPDRTGSDFDHTLSGYEFYKFFNGLTTLETVLLDETAYNYKGNLVCCSGAEKYYILYNGKGEYPKMTINLFHELDIATDGYFKLE